MPKITVDAQGRGVYVLHDHESGRDAIVDTVPGVGVFLAVATCPADYRRIPVRGLADALAVFRAELVA